MVVALQHRAAARNDHLRLAQSIGRDLGLIVRGLPDLSAASQGTTVAPAPATEAGEPQVIIPRSSTVIESNDHVVFFLPHKRLVREVEKLFRVSATFF